MQKKYIQPFDYANHIHQALKKGFLVTGKLGDQVNPMTISWGTLGVEWGMELFTVFVRENRFTKTVLDQNPAFTINIPYGEAADPKITAFCGRNSGRDVDKVKELGLTLVDPDVVNVPAIRELPLTLECEVIYKQTQDPNAMPEEVLRRNYPQAVDSSFPGANRDFHTAYYGRIVAAYIIED